MPPCYCVDLNVQCNIEKMRSNVSDADQKLKSIKTCITQTSSSAFMQKLLHSQNENNLFSVVSSIPSANQPTHSDYLQINELHDLESLMEKSNNCEPNHAVLTKHPNYIAGSRHSNYVTTSKQSNHIALSKPTNPAMLTKPSNHVALNKLSNHVSLSKPVTKLTVPSISIPSNRTMSFVKQLSSPMYNSSHTITKPINSERCDTKTSEPSMLTENERIDSIAEICRSRTSVLQPHTPICLPVINTLPKLYSMIANNSRKKEKVSSVYKAGILQKTNIIEKTNMIERTIVSSQLATSYPSPVDILSSLQSLQTFQEQQKLQQKPLQQSQQQERNVLSNPVISVEDISEKCQEPILTCSDENKFLSTSSSNITQSSQTLLLALPETFNVSQFSNQTLNLDLNSQHILRALLQPSNCTNQLPSECENNGDVEEDNALPKEQVLYHDLSYVDPNTPTSKQSDKYIHQGSPQRAKDYFAIISQATEDDKLNIERTYPCSPNFISRVNSNIENEGLQIGNDMVPKLEINQATSPNNIETHELEGNDENEAEEDNSPLPVAAINVDMIDGQPMYTIQIMGHYIPLSAITIPTSDGPLHLQSATASLTSQSNSGKSTRSKLQSESAVTFTNADSNTVTTTTDVSLKLSTTTKPRYTCEICGKSYIRSWSYYGHLREHAGETKEHRCSICDKTFAFLSGLKQHMLTHSGEKKVTCGECGKVFHNVDTLCAHQLIHADEKSHVCRIPDCDKTFVNASALKIHQRVHQEGKPYKCTDSGCNKAFKTKPELARHQFRHTGEKPYKCDKCDKAFVRNDDLKRHYFIHTGQKRFRCDQCDFSCIQSFDLVKHRYIHGGEKPYKCNACTKQFTRPARLREHQRLHTGERPYTCDECGKSFTQMTSLKAHKLAHEQKTIPCGKCEKTFTNHTELQDHMNYHIGTKPFQCMLCNKNFVSSKTLKRHTIVHSGEKPFECEICKKRFARPSDLKVHMLVHEENKPYKCSECPKTFTRYSSLKEHHRLHTGEYPFRCEICNKIFNHRSHLNVHMRTHTGEKPHKCPVCRKEFSRNSNLKLHLRVHGAHADSGVVEVEEDDDDDGNFSDSSLLDGQQDVQLDAVNVSLLKTIQNVLKRKREEPLDGNEDMLSNKRHITEDAIADYTEQVLTNLAREQHHLQVGEVTVVDTSNLSSVLHGENQVLVTQLPSDQLTPLADNIISNDDGTVVALGLHDYQTGNENMVVENLIQLNRFGTVEELDGHSFVMKDEEIQSVNQEQITGAIMMVNSGQTLNAKQQIMIPKSTARNEAMPMFVPISMANNVSVLRNQSVSNDHVDQFDPGTTLHLQTQSGNMNLDMR